MYSRTSRDLFDKENRENLKIFSKKIKKDDKNNQNSTFRGSLNVFSRQKPFRDITNQMQKKASFTNMVKDKIQRNNFARRVLNHNVYLEDKFTVDNHHGMPKTNKYTTLSYMNNKTKRIYKFYCFRDKDLDVPIRYANKVIEHSIDNDCYTDDGQIKGAVIKLYRNMESSLKEILKEKQRLEEKEESEIDLSQMNQKSSNNLRVQISNMQDYD